MEFIIVTGLSGSGKSSVVNVLEDIGYFCIDNMPPQLIPKFAEICKDNEAIQKVALVTDIRGGTMFLNLGEQIKQLKDDGFNVKILFVDANFNTVSIRYKETRRKHPLQDIADGNITSAISAENEILKQFKETADYYIDTSNTNLGMLKEKILNLFLDNINDSLSIICMSFGFKHGLPHEADLTFDVRFLPNPYYIPELRGKTGKDNEVADFVMASDISRELEIKIFDLIDFTVPQYIKEGKSQLVIAFGCTGGHHRSVTFAESLKKHLKDKEYKTSTIHRDILK